MRKKSSAATPNSNFNPKLRRLALLEAGQGCGAHRSPNCGKPRRTSHEVYARGWGVKNRGVLGSVVPFFLIPVSQFSNLIRTSLNFLKPIEFSSFTTFSASSSGKQYHIYQARFTTWGSFSVLANLSPPLTPQAAKVCPRMQNANTLGVRGASRAPKVSTAGLFAPW